MKKVHLILLIMFLCLVACACESSLKYPSVSDSDPGAGEDPGSDPGDPDPAAPVVYILGSYNGQAAYWTGDEIHTIMPGSTSAITVHNDVVHIAAVDSEGKHYIWNEDDKTPVYIQDNITVSRLYSHGGSLYATGKTKIRQNEYGLYWKVGDPAPVLLSPVLPENVISTALPNLTGMLIQGETVYVVGSNHAAFYWESDSGNYTAIANAAILCITTNIAETDNGVYMGGYCMDFDGNTPFYYKLGDPEATKLPALTSGLGNGFLAATEDDVYIVGYYYDRDNIPKVYKYRISDGQITILDTNARVLHVTTHGNDIYIAGLYIGSEGNAKPCYWKNWQRFDVPIAIKAIMVK